VYFHRGLSGHLCANRYFSTALNGTHVSDAASYVEANPLRARIVTAAEDRWSSCRTHAGLEAEAIARQLDSARPFPGYVEAANWTKWINAGVTPFMAQMIRLNTTTGRPTGEPDFVDKLERELDPILRRQKVGRKPSGLGPGSNPDDLFKMAEK
jgi:putative transposase